MGKVACAGCVFYLWLLGERVSNARPEILLGSVCDDGGIYEDVRRCIRVGVALQRVVIVVHNGDGRGARAVGADGGYGENRLLGGDRRGLHGVDGFAAADGEGDVRLLERGAGLKRRYGAFG